MKKYHKIFAGVILFAALAFSLPSEKYFEIAKNLDIFATLFKEVNLHYVDEVNPEKLIRVGIDAMLESLDPYTNYIDEAEVESFRSMTTGQYAGIGALIGRVGIKVVFTHPYEGMPANKAGLKVGDEIVEVDGINVKSKSPHEISALLKGNARTEVKITVNRYGNNTPVTYTVKRERISIKNVSFSGMLNNEVGFIKLDDFTPGAGKEVAEAVSKLKSHGANSIILDLRENPGGMLQEAVNIVNVFIPKGKAVVSTKGKQADWNKTYYTLNSPTDVSIPLAVLIGPTSASASEIVAGALQDYDRAVLVGKRTFGKGLVQTTRPLTYNGQLKVTTAKYYIPSGRCIQSLDYLHRDENGKANRLPDSLRIAFKTENGRTVFDGSGLEPDVSIDNEELAPITMGLLMKGLIFDYATEFYYQNEGAMNFSDKDYMSFINWTKSKNFSYSSMTEQVVDELALAAKEERNHSELEMQVTALKSSIDQIKQNDFEKFREEILLFLRQEVAFRYNLIEGQMKESFPHDKELQKTIDILNSRNELSTILSKN